jgi:hypothetical protein
MGGLQLVTCNEITCNNNNKKKIVQVIRATIIKSKANNRLVEYLGRNKLETGKCCDE